MIPQIISKIATFRPFNLPTDEIVAGIGASFVCPRNMILDILSFQNNLTDSDIIGIVGRRESKGLYAEQLPIRNEAKQAKQEELKQLRNEAKQAKQEELKKLRNEAKQAKQEERKQVLADAKLASQLAAKLNGVQACHRLKLVTGIASAGGSSSSSFASSAPVVPKASPAKPTTMSPHSSSVVSLPSPITTAKAASASASSSGASVSTSVPIVTAAKAKAKPVQKKSVVEYWIEIEDQQFMIDKNGNVFDPENDKKIGKYDKMQKKWLSGGIPSVDDEATEVQECNVELLVPAAASASSTSSASSSSSSPSASSTSSQAVSSASAAITKAKPVQNKSAVEYDWITIEDELFTIDSHGNVFDNDKKIGVYDKMQKKWLSGISSVDDEARVEECSIDLLMTAASASSSSMAAKYDAVRPSQAQRVRAGKNPKLSKSGASLIAFHIGEEAALTKPVLFGGIGYTYNFHSIFDKNGTCIVKFQSPDCNLSDERLREKVKKAISNKTYIEKKKIQLQILRQQAVRFADVKEIVNQ
jgi:hypothetical protein